MDKNIENQQLEDLCDFREDLCRYDKRSPEVIQSCAELMTHWFQLIPRLRYFGESPCWRTDCPFCGAKQELWVTVGKDSQDSGWNCGTCNREGPDTKSLRIAMVQFVLSGNPLFAELKEIGGWTAVADRHGAEVADFLLACCNMWDRDITQREKATEKFHRTMTMIARHRQAPDEIAFIANAYRL